MLRTALATARLPLRSKLPFRSPTLASLIVPSYRFTLQQGVLNFPYVARSELTRHIYRGRGTST
jgi:hypothetical protein